MNILFVGKRSLSNTSGIEKKMMGQIRAFEKLGHHVYFTFFDSQYIFLSDLHGYKKRMGQYKDNIVSKYLANEKAIKLAIQDRPNFFQLFYMRKGMCSIIHIANLKRLKKQSICVIEEIPTYPYDDEMKHTKGLALKVYLLCDRLFRPQLKKYVNKFVIYSAEKEIFGVPTIQIQNGIDLSEIPLRVPPQKAEPYRILTVSAMYFWHGYDRLIRGLADYYSSNATKEVHIEMVGNGNCTEEWEKLAKDLKVDQYVHFNGTLCGKELDDAFNISHVAVSSLGIFRKGIYETSELKIREYVARGIPFVVSSVDRALTQENFYIKIADSEENVSIEEIVDFINLYQDDEQSVLKMHEYAKEHFTWEHQLQKILNNL